MNCSARRAGVESDSSLPETAVLTALKRAIVYRMKARVWITTAASLILMVSCRQKDIRTVEIRVPEMRNRACMEVVARAISRVPGVNKKTVAIDPDTRVVSVEYDSLKLALKNIEFAIAKSGFAANDVPANENAAKKLPDACKAGK